MEKRGNNKLIILSLVFSIFLLSFISASVSCNPTSISKTYTYGQSSNENFQCTNSGNESVSLTFSGDFSLSSNSLGDGSTKTFTITFNPTSSVGLHSGIIDFSEGDSIPVSFLVNEQSNPSSCSINIFPTTLTNIKISQGETKTRTITLSVPSCFSSSVTVQGISLQTDQKPITLGELSAGNLNPGQSINIPIEINAEGISIGQYNDVLQFLLYNSSGNTIPVPNTNIGVLVSQGVTPISNFSTTEIPTCTLSSVELNLNQTYSLSCSISNPNIKVEPSFDNDYVVGISDTSTSSQYIYNFKAKKIGNTVFEAIFYYEGSNGKSYIGEPFTQNIKITNTGNSPITGTSLDLIFYQDGLLKTKSELQAKETIIQAVDNSSRNLVSDYQIQLGGVILANNSLVLEAGKIYNMRIIASGFNDLVTNLTASQVSVPFEIYPSKTTYNVGDSITLNSSVSGTSFLIGDSIIISPYTLSSQGTFTVIARNQNYADNLMNISVANSVFSLTGAVTWEKGDKVEFELNKISTWEVYFTEEGSTESEIINSGTGTKVSFRTRKAGLYEVKADGVLIQSQTIEAGKYPYWKTGLYILGALVVMIFFIAILKKKNSTSYGSNDTPSYGLPGNYSGEAH